MFDKPQNWQAMLQWLWEHGDKREIARSIPQLDPQILRALVDEKDSGMESDQMNIDGLTKSQGQNEDSSIRIARKAFAMGDIAVAIYEALVAFLIFKPSLHQDTPCHSDGNMGHQEWHISFQVRNLVPILAAGKTADIRLGLPISQPSSPAQSE